MKKITKNNSKSMLSYGHFLIRTLSNIFQIELKKLCVFFFQRYSVQCMTLCEETFFFEFQNGNEKCWMT